MNRIILFFFLLLSAQLIQAQSPEGINYQMVLRDGNTILANQAVTLIYSTKDANGNILYKESQNVSSNAFGQISAVLGAGTPVIGQFDQINWSQGGLQFEMEASVNGTTYSLGQKPLQSVPYALFSTRAGSADIANMGLNDLLDVSASPTVNGQVLVWDGTEWVVNVGTTIRDSTVTIGRVLTQGQGQVTVFSPNGSGNVILTSGPTEDLGMVAVLDTVGFIRSLLDVGERGEGRIITIDPTGHLNFLLAGIGLDSEIGAMSLNDSTGAAKVVLSAGTTGLPNSGSGYMVAVGSNGFPNFVAGANFGNSNKGSALVVDSANFGKAGMYIDASNYGILFGDIKNFRMPHPSKPGKEIWYASLEGPEAAAYVRGTAQLVNGEVEVSFPDHFQELANPQTMTVILTPLSAESEGLAVIEKTATGFKVKELRKGTGTYGFDWEVKCVRQGFENYRVERDASEMTPRVSHEKMHELMNGTKTLPQNLIHSQSSPYKRAPQSEK